MNIEIEKPKIVPPQPQVTAPEPATAPKPEPVQKGFFGRMLDRLLPPGDETTAIGVGAMNRRDELFRIWADRLFIIALSALAIWWVTEHDSEAKKRTLALEKKVEIIVDTVNKFGAQIDGRMELIENRTDLIEAKQKSSETDVVN